MTQQGVTACSERKDYGDFLFECQLPAKYEVAGVQYCGTHNPPAVARRRAASRALSEEADAAFTAERATWGDKHCTCCGSYFATLPPTTLRKRCPRCRDYGARR